LDVVAASTTALPVTPSADAQPIHGRGLAVPRVPLFFSLLLVLVMTLFAVLRLGLIVRNAADSEATAVELRHSFVAGARFDLATAIWFAGVAAAVCYVPWLAPWRSPGRRRAMVWGLTAALSAASLVLLCEYEFFREFQSRFNQLAIRYLDHPRTVGAMVWHNYPVGRYLLAWAALSAGIYAAVRAIVAVSFRAARGPAARAPGVAAEVVGAAVIVVVCVIGGRGGVGSMPLKWGDAFGGENEFANQMALNGLWSLARAAADTFARGGKSGQWAGGTPLAEARAIVRGMIVTPDERLLDPAGRTVLRTGDPTGGGLPPVALRTRSGRPPNVVLVLMESFSARFVGAAGAPRSFTPAFDALAAKGVLFDRCLSAGSHTHQGIFATTLGFPNLPGYETLMQSTAANQEFASLPSIFQAQGYETLFLYNGDLTWDNMRGFFRKQGVETFVGGDDVPEAAYRDAVWGVSDGDLFAHANAELQRRHDAGKPFMATVLTLSNHAPFQVPPVPGAAPITDQGEYNGRLTAMRYADHAVGRFVEQAMRLPYASDTLFVFVGDHGFHVPPVLTEVHLLYHHVPLLFFAPGLVDAAGQPLAPRVDRRVATQMNVVPSVLGLLGMNGAPHAAWARSLFADGGGGVDEGFAVFKMSGGGRAVALARGERMLILGSAAGRPLLVRWQLWPAKIEPIEGPEARELIPVMQRELRAYLQAALFDLNEQRAGPVEPE